MFPALMPWPMTDTHSMVVHILDPAFISNVNRCTMTFGGDYGFKDSAEIVILSACAESIILSAPPAESIILSAPSAKSMILSARLSLPLSLSPLSPSNVKRFLINYPVSIWVWADDILSFFSVT
jgi:hypothetical protein